MFRSKGILGLWLFLCPAVLLTASFFFNAQTTNLPADNDPNAVHWEYGELIAPLPIDPAVRAEAIRQAKEMGKKTGREDKFAAAERVQSVTGEARCNRFTGHTSSRPQSLPQRIPALPFEGKLRMPDEPFVPSEEGSSKGEERTFRIDAAPAAPAYATVAGSFDGIDDTGWSPASPSIAVGSEQVLMAANDAFAVYDKCGNYLYGGVLADYFWLSSNYLYYDPKVLYDDWHGRWIMVYQANDFTNHVSLYIVCVSASGNLGDGWGGIYFINDPSPTDFLDNTYIAVDPEALYISFNGFDYDTYVYEGAMIIAMNKEEMYDFAPTSYRMWYNLYNPADASLAMGVRPARMHTYNGYMYFLNNKYSGGNFFTLWTLTDPLGSPLMLSSSISTTTYEMPPNMQQPNGTYVDVGDCRITDLIYDHDELQAVFTRLLSSGGDWSRISVWKFEASTADYLTGANFYSPSGYLAYGAIDVDEFDRTCITVTECSYSTSKYLSLYYFIYDTNVPEYLGGGTFAFGLADYTLGGSGTTGSPYRWGNYNSCQIDPVDNRTFWCAGAYASNDPIPSWGTRIAATTGLPESDLDISPESVSAGGPSGGSFTQETFNYTLENGGQTNLNWSLSNVPNWLTPSTASGIIPPYGFQNIMLILNVNAYNLPPGVYMADLAFENCTGSGSMVRRITLYIEEEITCPGALIELIPEGVSDILTAAECSLSVFIRPMKDVEVCGIGIRSYTEEPQMITGRVFESDGFNRQTLLGEVTYPTVYTMEMYKIVPMDLTLKACLDYEIEFSLPSSLTYLFYDEGDVTYPFDVDGVIRITEGGTGGSYLPTILPDIAVYGRSPCNRAVSRETNLLVDDPPLDTEFVDERGSGLYITAQENMELCSAEFEADLPKGSHLQAWVWTAAGNVRDDLLSEGHILVETTGMTRHEVPLHALLQYGEDYNIEFLFWDGGTYSYVDEAAITLPFASADGAVLVRKGSYWGTESARLPHIRLNWSDFASGGIPFDLAKASDGIPPPYSSTDPLDHGAFITTNVTQQVFGLGVRADIPPGSILYARVYSTGALMKRVSMLSEGWIYTAKEGMQWHDVPIAFEARSFHTYDVSIVCSTVNQFNYWDDTSGLPYAACGLYAVEDAEIAGSSSGTELIHMRIHACDNELTDVGEEVPSFTHLYLNPPIPNPSGGEVTVRYSLDQAGTGGLVLYDVLGRRVATVFQRRRLEAGPGTVQFDTRGLASGVYFMKLTVHGRAGVSQKLVVQH